jgi:hypothetical protein
VGLLREQGVVSDIIREAVRLSIEFRRVILPADRFVSREGAMRLSEDKVRRLAERLHDELEKRGVLAYKERSNAKRGEGRAARVKYLYEYIVEDLRREDEIDAEVEQILDSYSRTIKGTERDILFRKHKEDVARKKGYVL